MKIKSVLVALVALTTIVACGTDTPRHQEPDPNGVPVLVDGTYLVDMHGVKITNFESESFKEVKDLALTGLSGPLRWDSSRAVIGDTEENIDYLGVELVNDQMGSSVVYWSSVVGVADSEKVEFNSFKKYHGGWLNYIYDVHYLGVATTAGAHIYVEVEVYGTANDSAPATTYNIHWEVTNKERIF